MCNVDKAYAIAASRISSVMPYINRYFQSVSSDSFYPEIIDLANIWNGLCFQKPEVVIEIGGGVSTSLISYYCSNHNAKHILIDPEEYWVENTFKGLEICGLSAPIYEPLPTIEKNMSKALGIDHSKIDSSIKAYHDFDYSNSSWLDMLSNCGKKLIFVDANCKNSLFKGAEIFIDPTMSQVLSDSLVLVDWRIQACVLLSMIESAQVVYSTNTHINFDDLQDVGKLINYGFSAFSIC